MNSNFMAGLAKNFVPKEYHSMIDQALQVMGKYPNNKQGAMQALQEMGGTQQDIKKMIEMSNNAKLSSFFDMLGMRKEDIVNAGNELLQNGSQTQSPTPNKNISDLQQRLNKFKR